MNVPARRASVGAVWLLVAALVSACGTGTYSPTIVPPPTATTTAAGSTAAPATCDNATQSFDPAALSGTAADNAVKAIKDRGYLTAGVSADSLLLGSRNPLTGQIEGFDIDMVHAIAKAIFADEDPKRVNLVVIPASDRIKALQDKRVDVVVRNMTMTCDRWTQIAFSAEYYHSGLKILVQKDSPITTLEGLAGKKVCAPNGTSTIDKIKATQGISAVGAATHTGCLVLFQEGEVDAIAGDDTVLAGLVAQDPYAKVPEMQPLTQEPYGIGVNKDQVDLVRYVNRVLDAVKADGRWTKAYNAWFFPSLKVEASPPTPVYGR